MLIHGLGIPCIDTTASGLPSVDIPVLKELVGNPANKQYGKAFEYFKQKNMEDFGKHPIVNPRNRGQPRFANIFGVQADRDPALNLHSPFATLSGQPGPNSLFHEHQHRNRKAFRQKPQFAELAGAGEG